MSKKLLFVVLFTAVFALLITGCTSDLLNETTGKPGPSWDTNIKLPVESREDNFGELFGLTDYEEFAFEVKEDNISFFLTGTEENPFTMEESVDLKPLEFGSSGDYIIEQLDEEYAVVDDDNEDYDGEDEFTELDVDFPLSGTTFGSGEGNEIKLSLTNTTNDPLDERKINKMVIGLYAGNDQVDEVVFEDLATDSAEESSIDFDDEKITSDTLTFKVKEVDVESDDATEVEMDIEGFDIVKIDKAEDVDISDFVNAEEELITMSDDMSFEDFGGLTLDEGDYINFEFLPPESTNLEFDFTSSDYKIAVNGENGDEFTKENTNEFKYEYDDGTNEISGLYFNGGVLAPDGNINYDASESFGMDVKIVGTAEFSQEDMEIEINEENGNLVHEMEAMDVQITEDDIENLKQGINTSDTYLETVIDNQMNADIEVEVYLGKEDNLYDENNLAGSLLSIKAEDEKTHRFDIGKTIDDIDEKLQEGDVYMGMKVIVGDVDDDDRFDFSPEDIISVKSHMNVGIKVNQ
ncbi:MAG: hypothetical protein ACOCZR_00465 [Halanaerobiales bacterium]